MDDHSDERLQRVAKKMRDAFFSEFGQIGDMDDAEQSECIRSLVAIHSGELIEFAARFRAPDQPIRDVAINIIDVMLEANADIVATLIDDADKRAYLAGDQS